MQKKIIPTYLFGKVSPKTALSISHELTRLKVVFTKKDFKSFVRNTLFTTYWYVSFVRIEYLTFVTISFVLLRFVTFLVV